MSEGSVLVESKATRNGAEASCMWTVGMDEGGPAICSDGGMGHLCAVCCDVVWLLSCNLL